MILSVKRTLFLLCCVVSVFGGPPIYLDPDRDTHQPIWVELNDRFSIRCFVDEANVLVAIYRDNVPQWSSPVDDYGAELTFYNIQFSDAGWYTCTASNEFGRTYLDFLVLVGERPRSLFSQTSSGFLRVREGTRVELPCHFTGVPVPSVSWIDGFDVIEDDGRIEVDPLTNSLIINGFSQSDLLSFFSCNVSNMFGYVIEAPVTVFNLSNSMGSNPFQPQPGFSNNQHFEVNPKDTKFLKCVNNDVTDIERFNITFSWTKNLEDIVPPPNPSYKIQIRGDDPTASGYYCCEVHDGQSNLLDTYCITAIVGASPVFGDNINGPVTVYEGRTVHLLSTATSPSGYDHPMLSWNLVSGEPIESSASVVFPPPETALYSYLTIDTTNGDYPEKDIRSVASNTLTDTERETIQFRVSENPEYFGENLLSLNDWIFNGNGANPVEFMNEIVFEITYSGPGNLGPFISQTINVSRDGHNLYVSGRMRYDPDSNVNGAPAIRVLVDGVREHDPIRLPFDNSSSWQTVGDTFAISPNSSSVSVELVIRAMPREAPVNVDFFFSDINAVFVFDEPPPPPPPGLSTTVIIAMAIGAVLGVILLVALVVCLLCCCCQRKGSGAQLMRKMTSRYRSSRSFARSQPNHAMGSGRYIIDQSHKADEPEPMYEELQHSNREEEDEAYYVMPNGARPADTIDPEESLYARPDPEESLYARPDPEESLYAIALNSGPGPAIPPRDEIDKGKTQLSEEEDSAYLSILPHTGSEYLQLEQLSKPSQETAADGQPDSPEEDKTYFVVTDRARLDSIDRDDDTEGNDDANYTVLTPRPPSEESPYATASDMHVNLVAPPDQLDPPIPLQGGTANQVKAQLGKARPVSWAVAPLYHPRTTAASQRLDSKVFSQINDTP